MILILLYTDRKGIQRIYYFGYSPLHKMITAKFNQIKRNFPVYSNIVNVVIRILYYVISIRLCGIICYLSRLGHNRRVCVWVCVCIVDVGFEWRVGSKLPQLQRPILRRFRI